MAVVKDTASFIAKAIEIHGNRYDYSESEFAGADKPIRIKCEVHGIFEMAQAGNHYKKGNPCGCRKCKIRKYKTCSCGFVGYGRKNFPVPNSHVCCKCHAKNRHLQTTVECKCCGNRYPKAKKSAYCSVECWKKSTAKMVAVECVACGKLFQKLEYRVVERNCCSRVCQLRMRGDRSRRNVDWVARSKRRKAKHKKRQRIERMKSSESYAWYRALKRAEKIELMKNTPREKTWRQKFNSIVHCNLGREFMAVVVANTTKTKRKKSTWLETFETIAGNEWSTQDMSWTTKLASKASNQRSRIRRKLAAKLLKKCLKAREVFVTTQGEG